MHLDNDYEWGYLPNKDDNEELFACAKIADSLRKLKVDNTFEWGERFDYEVELVRAVQNPDGSVDPQIVEDVPDLTEGSLSGHLRTLSKIITQRWERCDPFDGIDSVLKDRDHEDNNAAGHSNEGGE